MFSLLQQLETHGIKLTKKFDYPNVRIFNGCINSGSLFAIPMALSMFEKNEGENIRIHHYELCVLLITRSSHANGIQSDSCAHQYGIGVWTMKVNERSTQREKEERARAREQEKECTRETANARQREYVCALVECFHPKHTWHSHRARAHTPYWLFGISYICAIKCLVNDTCNIKATASRAQLRAEKKT